MPRVAGQLAPARFTQYCREHSDWPEKFLNALRRHALSSEQMPVTYGPLVRQIAQRAFSEVDGARRWPWHEEVWDALLGIDWWVRDVWTERHAGEHPPIIDEPTYRAAQAIIAGTSRVVRWTGTNPDYVLRSLVRCGRCGEMMCPGSTTKPSIGKTHRYYRCSRREKYGKAQCAERPLPAPAIEELVVAKREHACAPASRSLTSFAGSSSKRWSGSSSGTI